MTTARARLCGSECLKGRCHCVAVNVCVYHQITTDVEGGSRIGRLMTECLADLKIINNAAMSEARERESEDLDEGKGS